MPDRIQTLRRGDLGRRTEHVLQRSGRGLGLADPLRSLRDPQRDELGAQVVEVPRERGLLGDLAERRDRDRVSTSRRPSSGRPSPSSASHVRSPAGVSKAQTYTRTPAAGSVGSTPLTTLPSPCAAAAAAMRSRSSERDTVPG